MSGDDPSLEAFPSEESFPKHDRFRPITTLGAGGMGVVYLVHDRHRNTRVALKTLRQLSADSLLRFKNEFRSLQDLHHPNLVSLGELFEQRGSWFFTMEYVEGTDLLSWVRDGDLGAQGDVNTD